MREWSSLTDAFLDSVDHAYSWSIHIKLVKRNRYAVARGIPSIWD
jgi:hypothetical protein